MTTIYIKDGTELPKRHDNDLYVTEKTLIHAAMKHYAPVHAQHVLDIGAGDGRWGLIAKEYTRPDVLVGVELELRPHPKGFDVWFAPQDFLTWGPLIERYDLIVSNPPYRIAEPIIRKAWEILKPGGTMIFLLRLAFMAGVDRYEKLWREIWPIRVGVLSRRPSFYVSDNGSTTNGTDFGLFVWQKSRTIGRPVGEPLTWKIDLINYERDRGHGRNNPK